MQAFVSSRSLRIGVARWLRRLGPCASMLVTVAALQAAPAQAGTLYVANNGNDLWLCSRTQPCRSISQAMSLALAGDKIKVGPGRYGDLDGDGTLSGLNGEEPIDGSDNMIRVDKQLVIVSRAGARATVLDAANVAGATVVDIAASGVVFGKVNGGFTLRGRNGLAVESGTTGVKVQGNVARSTNAGFKIDGISTVAKANMAVGGDYGFYVNGTAAVVSGNVARRSSAIGFDFESASAAVVTKNTALRNYLGFRIPLTPSFPAPLATFTKNSALGNREGIEVWTLGAFSGPVSLTLAGNNLFGNGDGTGNCGLNVINNDSNNNALTVNAAGDFWGAATGPGPNPADAVCQTSLGGVVTVTTAPPAKSEFKVLPPAFK